jgi:hypothetical protein
MCIWDRGQKAKNCDDILIYNMINIVVTTIQLHMHYTKNIAIKQSKKSNL